MSEVQKRLSRGKRLKKVRVALRLNQKEFGVLLGKSKQSIFQYENGIADTPISVYEDLYGLLVDGYSYITGKTEEMFRASKGVVLTLIHTKLDKVKK